MSHDYATCVLVVDDDADIRYLLREVLEDEGYQVVEAEDGVDAWEILNTMHRPAVVILDHNMPRLDGPGLMARIATESALLHRVALIYSTAAMHGATPHSVDPGLQSLLDILAASILWKPFEVDDLLRIVAQAAARLPGGGELDEARYVWYE